MRRTPDTVIACAATVVLVWPSLAHAHRLVAEFHVLPGKRVQVEAFFDIAGDPAKDAKVTVFQSTETLTEGKTNENGVFVFSVEKDDALRVVVDAGAGHRAELRIPAAALHGGFDIHTTDDRGTRITVKDVLLGVTFIIAIAAFVLSVRNAKKLSPPPDGPRP